MSEQRKINETVEFSKTMSKKTSSEVLNVLIKHNKPEQNMNTEKLSNEAESPAFFAGAVSSSSIIASQLCPKCKEKGSLKYKSYLMFSRVCRNDGTYVKLPTHPDYGK